MQCLKENTSSLRSLYLLLITLLLMSCGDLDPVSPEGSALVEAYLRDPAALARGRAIYEGSCATFCHEVEGEDAADLFDCEWRHGSTDEELYDIIFTGIPDTRMVGFGTNFPEGDADIWRLVAFLRANQRQCY